MTELEYTAFINTLAVAVAQGMEEQPLALLSAALTQLADTLETIAALRAGEVTETDRPEADPAAYGRR